MDMHTPGPWTLQPVGDETECNILGAGRELIATVSDNDARLIAKAPIAPKLAEVLRRVANDQICMRGFHEQFRAQIRDALAEWDAQ